MVCCYKKHCICIHIRCFITEKQQQKKKIVYCQLHSLSCSNAHKSHLLSLVFQFVWCTFVHLLLPRLYFTCVCGALYKLSKFYSAFVWFWLFKWKHWVREEKYFLRHDQQQQSEFPHIQKKKEKEFQVTWSEVNQLKW